jgi:hypothetical protein
MHPVSLSPGEIDLLKQARAAHDWTILPTFKLKYVYQRLVALPRSDMGAVKAISKEAAIVLGKADADMIKGVEQAFGIND